VSCKILEARGGVCVSVVECLPSISIPSTVGKKEKKKNMYSFYLSTKKKKKEMANIP
jgi:hypothetical protein